LIVKRTWVLGCVTSTLMGALSVAACSGDIGDPGATSASAETARADELRVDAKKKDAGVDAAVDCGTPSKLFKETKAGVFCPYSEVGDAGDVTCAAGELCCQPDAPDDAGVYPPSKCEKKKCKAADDISWQCEGPLDCASSKEGPVCCGYGTPEKEAPQCSDYAYVSGAFGLGTVCAASCAAGTQTVICDSKKGGECPSGTTCTPVRYHGNQVGYCL
jgi:hypothetical protein